MKVRFHFSFWGCPGPASFPQPPSLHGHAGKAIIVSIKFQNQPKYTIMTRRNKQTNSRQRKNRNTEMLSVSRPRNSVSGTAMSCPNLGPTIQITRRIEEAFDIDCDGINPSYGVLNFSLNDLPGYAEFTALFQLYRIDEIEIQWRPEYTQLVDSGLASNAVNIAMNTAISVIGNSPANVSDVLQNSNCSSTPINRVHNVRFRPAVLMDGTSPCYCFLSSLSPSTNWWGVQYGINPTGVEMTFRSTAVFKLSLRAPQ